MSIWITEQINQIWSKVNSFLKIEQLPYRTNLTGQEKLPIAVLEGSEWKEYQIDVPFSNQEVDFKVDVESVSIASSNESTIKNKLLDVLNNRTPVLISRPRKYVVTAFVGYTYIKEEYSHDAGLGSFGLAATQFLLGENNSNISRINRIVIETENDPNNLEATTSIEDSINNGGEYLVEVRDIFTRTINGEFKTYWYNGTQLAIGGSNTNVVASDFDDITANGTIPNGNTNDISIITLDNTDLLNLKIGSSHYEVHSFNNAAITIHIPADGEYDDLSTEPKIGNVYELYQDDATHTPLITVSSGVTIKKQEGDTLEFIGEGSGIKLIKTAPDTWRMVRLGVG